MSRTSMRWLLRIAIAGVILLVAGTARADTKWHRTRGYQSNYSRNTYGSRRRTTLAPPDPRQYHQWYYPRYYGGFHARYFEDFGYPARDRTLRGQPW